MRKILTLLAATALLTSCSKISGSDDWTPQPYATVQNAPWTKDAVLYQINTRQFTPEGTFASAQKQLPRLKALGIDIIWLMPIHPIGEKNRKGKLGSPYSVRDYYAVNPEFGTKADLKAFVDDAHRQGMHVILDLVANHTAWDNKLATEHPDWYEKTGRAISARRPGGIGRTLLTLTGPSRAYANMWARRWNIGSANLVSMAIVLTLPAMSRSISGKASVPGSKKSGPYSCSRNGNRANCSARPLMPPTLGTGMSRPKRSQTAKAMRCPFMAIMPSMKALGRGNQCG